ncbi:MAG: DUF413 domain-containing protein [Gemmataceae bacterium]|nr:DUF413 domain-containing protein [Gemmataceae bacterium]
MPVAPEHAVLLARGNYPVHPAGEFDDAEREVVAKYGHWMEALAAGVLAPTTPDQERFVRAARGEAEPASAFEVAWAKQRAAVAAHGAPAPNWREAKQRLAELLNVKAAVAAVEAEYTARRAAVLDKVRAELDAVDAAFAGRMQGLADALARAEVEARAVVLAGRSSVRQGDVYAMFLRERVTWDGAGLGEYVKDHPEVARFRKVGKASVQLRYGPPPERRPPQALGPRPVQALPPAGDPPTEEPY